MTYDQLRQELAAAAPGASLDFSLAPGEILEVEEQLVVSGITVSISSAEPGGSISRAAWANNSRVFEVRDGGHLLLAQVVCWCWCSKSNADCIVLFSISPQLFYYLLRVYNSVFMRL